MMLSSTLEPLRGRQETRGGRGGLVTAIGVFAIMFGLITSLGLAWAPFGGEYIARISWDSTLRTFVAGVLLMPALFSAIWFSVFGGLALHEEHLGAGGIADAVARNEAAGFFVALELLPATGLLIPVGMLVAIFFITSSDSGTYFNGMMTSEGMLSPPCQLRAAWGIIEGAVASIILLVGGLEALPTASIIGGFSFMIFMILMIYCLFKALYSEFCVGDSKNSGAF